MEWLFGSVRKPFTSLRDKRPSLVNHLRFTIFFYLLVPCFLALLSGLSSSGSQALKHPHYYVIYWLCTAIPAWMAAGIGTALVSRMLRPFLDFDRFHLSFMAVLVLGYLVGMNLLWMPLSEFRNDLLAGLAMPGQPLRHAWAPTSSYLAIYQVMHGFACWIGFNYLAAALFGLPRFGFYIDSLWFTRVFDRAKTALEGRDTTLQDIRSGLSKVQIASRDELSARIAPRSLDSIIAMQAEDHYTQVYFKDAELLIYMRFSSAVQGTVSLEGFQTHRSYWVRLESVQRQVTKGGKKYLELYTGRLVPISRERKSSIQSLMTERWA